MVDESGIVSSIWNDDTVVPGTGLILVRASLSDGLPLSIELFDLSSEYTLRTAARSSGRGAGGATYTYTVAAFDTAGNTSAQSSPVSATTPSSLAPPSVVISSPTNGTTIKNGSVNIVSSASDANPIHSMTIKGDSNVLRTCTGVTSCSATWQQKNISKGTHVITATAIDQSGSQASTSVTILTLGAGGNPHGD